MPSNKEIFSYPGLARRLYAIWFRHMRVYRTHLISNGLPPFLEPLIFLAGIGLGLGHYIRQMGGVSYIEFLATGLLVTSSMYTASFETTFGTYIRMRFEKVYEGMLATPITVNNLILGEILWAGSKGFFFSLAVLLVIYSLQILKSPWAVLIPFVGMLTGLMFGAMGILVTSYIKNINHFNFFFTGFLSPMFFFSGVVFPIEKLPELLQPMAEIFPLTHSVRLARMIAFEQFHSSMFLEFAIVILFTAGFTWIGILRLRRKLVD